MQVVEEVLEKWRPEAAISSAHLHTLTLSQLRHMHGQQVVISMMIQDCLEPEFYAGALLPKCGSEVIVNKYWASDKPIEDFDKYESLLLQREVYHVVPVAGQS